MMKHVKKNSGNKGLYTPANRGDANQKTVAPALPRQKNDGAGNSDNHPAEDPRLRSYYEHENHVRFSRSAQQRPHHGAMMADTTLQRRASGPLVAYEVNDVRQHDTGELPEDEARTLDRIRMERSRLLDDE